MYNKSLIALKNNRALVKVVDCPLHDKTSIAFVINQLVDPSHNRPIKKLAENADRHYKWNTISGNWEYRYTNSPRGNVKNTIYTKKTSMTLLPPNGKMHLFNYNHGVILIFDRDSCILSDQYIFAENVVSNDRWWIWGNSGIAPKRAIGLDDLIKINYRNMNRDFVGSHNEILAKLTQSGFSGVAAPIDTLSCRLNTLRIGYFMKLRLHLPSIDFLIITATDPAKIYDEHQQSADIGHAFAKGERVSFEMACNLVNYASLLQNFMDYCQTSVSAHSLFSMLKNLVQAKKIDLALEILNKKPDLDYCRYDSNGNTLWHHAVISGNAELLIRLNALEPSGLCQRNPQNGRTPLSMAIYNNQPDLIKLMVCELRNTASREDCESMLLDLLRANNRVWLSTLLKNSTFGTLCLTDYATGNTALHYAVIHKNSDLVALILALNCDPCVKNHNQRTPFVMALYNASYDIVNLLLEYYVIDDLNTDLASRLFTWLMYTRQFTRASHLLENASAIRLDYQVESDNMPLHFAVLHDQDVLIKMLCSKGANILAENKQRQMPLLLALEKQNHFANLMIETGAKWIPKNQMSKVIFILIKEKKPDAALWLLEKRPDYQPNGSYDPKTMNNAMHLAVINGYAKMLIKLYAVESRISEQNAEHQTPFTLALSLGQNAIASEILLAFLPKLTRLEVNTGIKTLIKNNTIGLNFFKKIHHLLDEGQILFYVYKLINNAKTSLEVINIARNLEMMPYALMNEKTDFLLYKIAKLRILKIAYNNQCQNIQEAESPYPGGNIRTFLQAHENPLLNFFFDPAPLRIFNKIMENIPGSDTLIAEEKKALMHSCGKQWHSVKHR